MKEKIQKIIILIIICLGFIGTVKSYDSGWILPYLLYNETDPIFTSQNSTIWSEINNKLNLSDQRYNETQSIIDLNNSKCNSDGTNCLNQSTDLTNINSTNITTINLNVSNQTTLSDWIILPETYGNEMIFDNGTGIYNCTLGVGWTNQGSFVNRSGAGGYLTCNLTEALIQNASYRLEFALFNVTTPTLFYAYLGSATANTNVLDYWVDTSEMKNQSYVMYGYTLRTPGTVATTNKILQLYSTGTFLIQNISLKRVYGGTISSKNMTLGQGFLSMGRDTIKFYNYADKIHLEGACIGNTCEYTTYSEDLNAPDGARIGVATISGTGVTHAGCGTQYMTESCGAGQQLRTQTYYSKNSTLRFTTSNHFGNLNRTYPLFEIYENITSLGKSVDSGFGDVFYINENYTLFTRGGFGYINTTDRLNTSTGKIIARVYNETSNTEINYLNQQFLGNITGNLIYGEMYNFSDVGSTINIATSGAYYNITGLKCGYINGFNCSPTLGTLITTISGIYQIHYNLAVETSTADGLYGAGISKNYQDLEVQERCYSRLYTRMGEQHNIGGNCYLNLSVGDTINFMIDDEVSPARTTVWQTIEFTATRIGN